MRSGERGGPPDQQAAIHQQALHYHYKMIRHNVVQNETAACLQIEASLSKSATIIFPAQGNVESTVQQLFFWHKLFADHTVIMSKSDHCSDPNLLDAKLLEVR